MTEEKADYGAPTNDIHWPVRPSCGIPRSKGLLVTGDKERATCPRCVGKKEVVKKDN